ncbi:MAG: hypothetical protein MUC93_11485 [Bacteroidales bacterium]|jgi:hypothetical protein|nr:hypothetical protein [Bacteroidales bacterium]
MNKLLILLICLLYSSCTSERKKESYNLTGKGVESANQNFKFWAETSPMGWNSFDAFDCRVNEDQFKKTVDFMAENLLHYGWNYSVIDYIWWHPSPGDW